MNKEKLKATMIEMEHKTIEIAESNYEDFLLNNKLDRTNVIDADDQSHHRASLELVDSLDNNVHEHHKHLEILQKISFGPTSEIKPGAVVRVNDRYLVVAISKLKFEFDGCEFMGISTDAPLYQCLKARKAGDEFVFNDREFKIQEVF